MYRVPTTAPEFEYAQQINFNLLNSTRSSVFRLYEAD